jgi:hypothetical protein
MQDRLAAMPDYPPLLAAYYRGWIDGLRFTLGRVGG